MATQMTLVKFGGPQTKQKFMNVGKGRGPIGVRRRCESVGVTIIRIHHIHE